jgi:hypothetical protein
MTDFAEHRDNPADNIPEPETDITSRAGDLFLLAGIDLSPATFGTRQSSRASCDPKRRRWRSWTPHTTLKWMVMLAAAAAPSIENSHSPPEK